MDKIISIVADSLNLVFGSFLKDYNSSEKIEIEHPYTKIKMYTNKIESD